MREDGKLILQDKNGNKKEYFILVTCEYKDKSFVIYTDYEVDENKKIKIYSAIYNPEDEEGKLEKVKDADDIEFVEEYIKHLEMIRKKSKELRISNRL